MQSPSFKIVAGIEVTVELEVGVFSRGDSNYRPQRNDQMFMGDSNEAAISDLLGRFFFDVFRQRTTRSYYAFGHSVTNVSIV